MYDRYSLARLLRHVGFQDPQAMHASESRIACWPDCCLDTGPDGSARKPDSLFMEAVRP